MHPESHALLATTAWWLGWFYAAVAALNAGAAVWAARRHAWLRAAAWSAWGAGLAAAAWFSLAGHPPQLPEPFKQACDDLLGPVTFTAGALGLLAVGYVLRRWLVVPAVAWLLLNVSLVWLGLSLSDAHFAAIVARPDNVPIVAMVYLLGFFTWAGTYQAVENDRRLARGQGPVEADYRDEVLVWPDVIYLELIGAILATVVLIVWSLLLRAPLEQPANPAVTPNPAKAPWYFLGLQELLVYFPPWLAGVILPALMILGLMAIPYLDFNPRGNGYYTIAQRRFAYLTFQFGFLGLWVLLILIGTFLRGPNWSFFGFYEAHDAQKMADMTNVSLAELFWVTALGRELPQVTASHGMLVELGQIAWREAPGLAALGLYYVALPWLLARTLLQGLAAKLGRTRYGVLTLLLLTMLALPLKMILVWTVHLSYVVNIPEYFFYF